MKSHSVVSFLCLLILTSPLQADSSDTVRETSQKLWELWGSERFVNTPAPCFKPKDLSERLDRLRSDYPDGVEIEEIGRSVQDRPIHLLRVGHGKKKVLLWSQMHGDEPSATPALLDIVAYLNKNRQDEPAASILDHLELLLIPMLNPDGAEVYARRNAQAIDVNRDALNLATPEGRLLKSIRDEEQPMLGFNLHDQNRRRTAGDTGVPAANALLAVTGDAENTLTPGRLLAKKACSAIAMALALHRPGGMARYDETWSPRSFGDNITAWGTPVVLIESGSIAAGTPFDDLTRLNFVGILTALEQLATGTLDSIDPEIYQSLPDNNLGPWTDVILRGGVLLNPGAGKPYRADIAFDLLRSDQQVAGCAVDEHFPARITEVGDTRERVGGLTVDVSGSIVTPPLTVSLHGWDSHDWLLGLYGNSLIQAGVGRVIWVVENSNLGHSREWWLQQETLDANLGIEVEVVAEAESPPTLRLPSLPASPPVIKADWTLGERLRAIVDDDSWSTLAAASASQLPSFFWSTPNSSAVIRPGSEASFLVLSPPADSAQALAGINLRYRLDAVWMQGTQHRIAGIEVAVP